MVNGFKTVLTKTDPNHPSKRVREKAAIKGHLILGRCEQCLSPKYRVTAIESPTNQKDGFHTQSKLEQY